MAEAPAFSLDDFMQLRWEALAKRLGDRRGALLQTIEDKARQHGFEPGLQLARFGNLCMALGPGFETRAENEWALAILINDKLEPWVKLHQLVVQGVAHLRRRGDDGEGLAQRLQDNDLKVLEQFDAPLPAPGSRLRRTQPQRLRRSACDLEAVEVRLLDTTFRQEYRQDAGQWTRVAVDAPAPVRITAQQPAPERITVLTLADGQPGPARLQVRTVYHSRCALGLHPAVTWLGSGREQWKDEAARAPAWSVSVPAVPAPHLLQEAGQDISLLQVSSCKVRDEGVPLGDVDLQVWAYPAQQCLVTLKREARLGFALPDPKSAPPAVKPTHIVFERDGEVLPAETWQKGFDDGLRDALGQGLQRLLDAWKPRVTEPSLRADIALFDGTSSLTWGWREGARGLASPPLQRVVGEIDWSASAELHLQGMVEYAGAKASLHLRIEGLARLQTLVERLQADVDLIAAMQGAVLRWRWPAHIDFDAVADDNGIIFSAVGPCSGGLAGSLGLRPSATLGGAWEWFATLAMEPVATRVVVHDPALGRSESHMALLGSVSLLDWSLA